MDFSKRHPDARSGLMRWEKLVAAGQWRSLVELRKVLPSADGVRLAENKTVTVFNIGGNKFRLIAAVSYSEQTAVVLAVMPHAEYSKDAWKGFL